MNELVWVIGAYVSGTIPYWYWIGNAVLNAIFSGGGWEPGRDQFFQGGRQALHRLGHPRRFARSVQVYASGDVWGVVHGTGGLVAGRGSPSRRSSEMRSRRFCDFAGANRLR